MDIQHDPNSDVERYIANQERISLERFEPRFRVLLRMIETVRPVQPGLRMLEIGTGLGWFPVMCALRGHSCKGIEISPRLVEYARNLGRSHGVEPDIELANIETAPLGQNIYDAIVCSSLFEHVQDWRAGLRKVFTALKPGGVLFFESTNKFSFKSGEYSTPLYGWLPNACRYRLRIRAQGPDIMRLGIDFNQFTYFGLRRAFRQLGFRRVLDRVDLADVDAVPLRKAVVVRCARRFRPLREAVLLFVEATTFVCVK